MNKEDYIKIANEKLDAEISKIMIGRTRINSTKA